MMCCIRLFDTYASVRGAIRQFIHMFTGKELLDLGLSVQDYCIVAFGVVAMFTVSMCGRNGSVREKISQKPYVIRYGLFVLLFFAVLLLGSYGVGFEAQQFIYNQF